MTEREAAIVAAYTCTQIGNFSTTHAYIEEILGRPVMTHQMADQRVWDEIKDKSRADFLALKIVAADQEDTECKEWRCAPGEHSWQRFPQISDGIVCAKCGADQEDTDASNDMPGASSLRSRSGDAVNAETTSLDGGGRQPGIERIMGRIVITSALNREVPGLTQSQYDRMADAAMDALINGDCLVPADQEDTNE